MLKKNKNYINVYNETPIKLQFTRINKFGYNKIFLYFFCSFILFLLKIQIFKKIFTFSP
jgi:hypothetical protein